MNKYIIIATIFLVLIAGVAFAITSNEKQENVAVEKKAVTIEEYRKKVPELLSWFHDLDSRKN